MPRRSQLDQKRKELLPRLARVFSDRGYRRTTTAELADQCNVQENILYRLWPDKKAMFLAAIDYVYELSASIWAGLLTDEDGSRSSAQRLLDHEARHHGEFGHHRIIFAGLSEMDDADTRKALAGVYQRYQRFLQRQVAEHRPSGSRRPPLDPALVAWALVGLGTITSIGREVGLLNSQKRKQLMSDIGAVLLDAAAK